MKENKLAEQVIVAILAEYMGLNSQNVYVRDQNLKIPNDKETRIVVGMVDEKVIAVNKSHPNSEDPNSLLENIGVVTRENIQIDIFGANTEVISRRWEIIAALASTISVQAQEENQFKIFRVPTTFANTSGAEGGSNINRFTIIIACHVWYSKESLLPRSKIFDTFETRIDDANTIGQDEGLFEFTITEGA